MEQHLPTRLHHTAYVTKDLEATRHFYEDLIGMPLTATWCESDELFGKVRMSGSSPSLEGWPVLVIGVLELFVGIIFIVRYLRTSRRG